ncbi:MAG: putative lipopolysaccharide heptosyltransferase III [Deltaproteobacteria bacterium]|nr:putative lipopolysaccharide heptosyltransferase III [Deltaproteobacteria bacterium]
MFDGVNNILVIKLRHIGDVLLTVPAIRALKESFKGSRVSALVNSGTEEMLTLNPLLDSVIGFQRSVKDLPVLKRISSESRFVKGLRDRGFDMAVDLTGGDRPALIGYLSGARYRLGYEPSGGFAGKRYLYTHLAKRLQTRTHTVLRDLGVVKYFGIGTKDLTIDIFTSPEDDAFMDALLRERIKDGEPFVHVHPTSRWLFKCWRDDYMAASLDWLQSRGLRAVITSGPQERELKKARTIAGLMKTPPVDLSGRLKLKHLAVLSRRSAFFFGVDSAPMHIAAASGARVVSVFGPSGAFDWGPWDNRAAAGYGLTDAPTSPYPEQNGVQTFGGNTVIQKDWDCVPCGKDGCNGSKKSDCLDALTPEEVFGAFLKII